jgi:sugar diacid utilization regulator
VSRRGVSAGVALTATPSSERPRRSALLAVDSRTWPDTAEATLQEIVDDLAAVTRHPVIVTDEQFNLRAHSPHGQTTDAATCNCILDRAYPTTAVQHFRAHRVEELHEPTMIPGLRGDALSKRICLPARWRQRLLGYVWLLCDDVSLAADDLERCQRAVELIAVAMQSESRNLEQRQHVDQRLLTRLLNSKLDERRRAADELVAAGRVRSSSQPAAVVVLAVSSMTSATLSSTQGRLALNEALDGVRRVGGGARTLLGFEGEDAVAVVTTDSRQTMEVDAARIAGRLHALLAEAVADLHGGTPLVAIGGTRSLLELDISLEQARAGVSAARVDERHGPIAHWDNIGVFRALTQLGGDALGSPADVHPGLAALLEHRSAVSLIGTLERYLDLGAEASITAAALHLHRSSLYYRLEKCQSVAGVDLRNGEDRLALHLAIKLARLRGWWPPR